MTNATTFGRQAETYARARPGYPEALFDWIAANSPGRNGVWDVGTGSGQAALSLAERFDHVHATDIDAAQIGAAAAHPDIDYHVAPADMSGLPDGSVDAVTVATALHWFADAAFWKEVARVARPGALFCAWSYPLPRVDGAFQSEVLDPLYALIDPYWAEGNRMAMRGYRADETGCPFEVLNVPEFDAGGVWSARRIMDFAESWSAHFRAREDGQAGALAAMRETALRGFEEVEMELPLTVLAARVG